VRAASAHSAPYAPVRLGLTGGSATPRQDVGRVRQVRDAYGPSSPRGRGHDRPGPTPEQRERAASITAIS
jgi:hypothetical protein